MRSEINGTARLSHMDLLKCLAMYFVLLFHGTLYDYQVYPWMTGSQVLRFCSRSVLSTCVPLFFFVNGYLLLSRPMDLKKHTRRTLRLMIVTCFWILFLLVVLQPICGESFTWEELWKDCWQLKDGWNNHLWYLCALVSIYFFFPLLKRTLDSDKACFYWFAAVAGFLLIGNDTVNLFMTLLNLLVKQEFWLYENNIPVFLLFFPFSFNIALGMVYFCLGGVVRTLEERIRRIPAKWRNLTAAVGLVGSCAALGIVGWRFSLYLKYTWDVVWNGYDTVFTLCSVLCLYLLSLNYRGSHKLIRLISANTLGIYLIHDLVQKLLTPYAVACDFLCNLPGSMVFAAAVLLISLGICLILKKIPLVKHLI